MIHLKLTKNRLRGNSLMGLSLVLISLVGVPRASFSAPATQVEATNYTNMGAMTICFLNALDVSFDKAMQASSTAMMRVLVDQHESTIQEQKLNRKPTEEELRDAVIVQLAIRTEVLCGEKFSGTNKSELDRVLEIIKERFSKKS